MLQDPQEKFSDHRAALPDELPEGYYLDDFQTLLRFVDDTYPHLLSDSEQTFISDFFSLEEDARKLFVRLSNRKGPQFRVDRLNYEELALEEAVAELIRCDFLCHVIPELADAVNLCNKSELLHICENASASLKKAELADLCLSNNLNPIELNGIETVEVLRQDELLIIKLLFFGNFHQDMTEFVLGGLIAPFENYEMSGEACPFPNRETVDRLVYLKQVSDLSVEAIELDETGEILLTLGELLSERPVDHVLRRRFDRVILRLARQLERLEKLDDAMELYARTSATPSRERRARIHAKQENASSAISLCADMIADPLDDEEHEFAMQFGARLAKKHELDWSHPAPRAAKEIPQKTELMQKTEDSVEMTAASHFAEAGFDAWYVENMLFRSLFGLAFWDVIFAPVPGAFFNPFQRAPQDIYTADFYHNRRELVDARLADIRDGQLEQLVLDCYRNKLGLANQFVNWTYLDIELLDQAMKHIPVEHCAAVFERLVKDVKDNCSGFPDLILFNDEGYRLIEIKGPGDKLQKNQIRWFHYFHDHGIPAEVVNVEYRV